ncbi:MAG: hypothetical protein APR63_06910 [Desulfuromonas sp. SDB]|nr:MAG: hypothetical protein APR63_06910 [Desulfuromonas sp. SDB]
MFSVLDYQSRHTTLTYASPSIVTYMLRVNSLIEEVVTLRSENQKLRKELAVLTLQRISVEDLIRENERLKRLLGFKEASTYHLIPAAIISRNQHYVNLSLVLSKGYRDGLYRGSVVIGVGGVVGKLIKVMSDYSVVQTFYDLNFRASAMDVKSGAIGIVSWDGRSRNLIFQVEADADVREGDRIVTTGIGGVYPRGLDIGLVEAGPFDRSTLFLKVPVIPSQELAALDNVFVISTQPSEEFQPEMSDFQGELIFEIGDWELNFQVE